MPAGVLQDGLKLEDVGCLKVAEIRGPFLVQGRGNRQAPDSPPNRNTPSTTRTARIGRRPLLLGQVPRVMTASRWRRARFPVSCVRPTCATCPSSSEHVDAVLEALGAPGNLNALGSTLGRTGIRQVETLLHRKPHEGMGQRAHRGREERRLVSTSASPPASPARARVSGRHRAAHSTMLRRLKTATSRAIRLSFRPRGTSLLTTRRASTARSSRRSSACRSATSRSRSTRCAPFTASTPAPLVLCM